MQLPNVEVMILWNQPPWLAPAFFITISLTNRCAQKWIKHGGVFQHIPIKLFQEPENPLVKDRPLSFHFRRPLRRIIFGPLSLIIELTWL